MSHPENPATDSEKQASDVLAQMSLREKLGQCIMIEPCFCLDEQNEEFGKGFSDVLDPEFLALLIDEYHIGTFLFGGVSQIGDGSPGAWADYIAKVDEYVQGTDKKLPMLYGIDAVHGVNFMSGSTIYTHNLAVAATWNPELARTYASTVGEELAAIGFNVNFAPTIDTARDVRWGRVYESLGEDPYLASQISRGLVGGMQAHGNLAACAKHFVGYGEARNGMDRTPADLSDRAILEMHAPPFEAAIEEDVLTMMVNGADVNGVPMPVSKKYLTGLLRKQMGFKGITMSDWEDVERLRDRHKVAKTRKDSLVRSFNAGLDMNMAVCKFDAVDIMEEAVEEGLIDPERVDDAAYNILLTKCKLGLFSRPPLDVEHADALVGSDTSKAVARQLARESITLLKNDDDVLPLSKTARAILVTGNAAVSKRRMCGGWTMGWAGAAEEDLDCGIVIDAIGAAVSEDTRVVYAATPHDIERMGINAEDFDVCVCVVSEEPHSEWVGDSMELTMEESEHAILDASVATGIPVVMLSMIGRPVNFARHVDKVKAILWAYLPGTEGAAPIADLLFGDANPSGRLPVSFPVDGSHVPVVYNAREYDSNEIWTRYEPLYPFGHGLSYTTFTYSDLEVADTVKAGDDLVVNVTVTNTGDRAGDEIVQLYLKDQSASVTRPLRTLQAFSRISLAAGESKTVSLTLTAKQRSLYDEELNFVEELRTINVMIADLKAEFSIV